MKTDRRHALQTNWLADHLGRWLEKLKPYTNHLITGALLVAAGLVVWLVVAKFWGNDEEKTWQQISLTSESMLDRAIRNDSDIRRLQDQLQKKEQERNKLFQQRPLVDDKQSLQDHQAKIQALSGEIGALRTDLEAKQAEMREREQDKLRDLARENIGSPAGWAAAFSSAQTDLKQGADELLRNPVVAREKLDRAIELFDLVKKETDDELLRQKAQYQLARAYETRLRRDPQHPENDDVTRAKREYEELVKQVPGYFKEEAQQRLTALDNPKNRVYTWVHDEVEKAIAAGTRKPASSEPPPELRTE